MDASMNICVVFGGPAREHAISIKSGINVARAALEKGYRVMPALWTRERLWKHPQGICSRPEELDAFVSRMEKDFAARTPGDFLCFLEGLGVRCVFPVLHGPWGEDGRIQGFFQVAGLAVAGQDVLGAAISMDKLVSKALLKAAGLPTAPWVELTEPDPAAALARVRESIGFPCVLKAPSEGSSFGVAILREESLFPEKYPPIFVMERRVLAEAFVPGRELTCGVLRSAAGVLSALLPTEIVPRISEYFDFEAKYQPGGSDEITPARITPVQTRAIQDLAVRAHEALRLGQLSRIDFILQEPDRWFILEANALPGFTHQSLFPQAAQAGGISFPELVDRLLRSAMAGLG